MNYLAASVDPSAARTPHWWERAAFLFTLGIVGLLPLCWPTLPPLLDLPGHMGRWHIALEIGKSAPLSHHYAFKWALVGNLGMDLLVPGLAVVLPFEIAAKMGVLLIAAITIVGLLWTAREAHGKVPPTALLALPFVYAWPFQLGFVNFALAQGLAFCAFAWWLRLGRLRRLMLRAAVFVPVSCGLWLAHSFGWGMFCLMAAGTELARLRIDKRTWRSAIVIAVAQSIPLALPLVEMVLTSHGQRTGDWFDWTAKGVWIASILRDRWEAFDIVSLIPIVLFLYVAARNSKFGFSALLGWPAFLCLLAFILLPRLAFGGAYVDMRIAPAVVMLGLLSIRPPKGSIRFAQTIAALAVAFFLLRTAGTTTSFVLRGAEQQRELAAIPSIPSGASVLSLVARPCGGVWSDLRRDHLPGMAIVRKDVFTNEQWDLEGQQLLRVIDYSAAPYLADPSQLVYPQVCPDIGSHFDAAMRSFPRAGFTHIWTIGFPPRISAGLKVIWTNGSSTLYQVSKQ